jgi:hypothetical protein
VALRAQLGAAERDAAARAEELALCQGTLRAALEQLEAAGERLPRSPRSPAPAARAALSPDAPADPSGSAAAEGRAAVAARGSPGGFAARRRDIDDAFRARMAAALRGAAGGAGGDAGEDQENVRPLGAGAGAGAAGGALPPGSGGKGGAGRGGAEEVAREHRAEMASLHDEIEALQVPLPLLAPRSLSLSRSLALSLCLEPLPQPFLLARSRSVSRSLSFAVPARAPCCARRWLTRACAARRASSGA